MTEAQKRPRGRPKSLFKESTAGTLQSLDRAIGILTAIARLGQVNLSDLAREINTPTATTHRILNTLLKHGFVGFNEERQEWSVGIEAYRVGSAFLKRSSVLEVGRPILLRLMQQTGETANLAVPDGPEVVFIGQAETQNPIRAFFPPGSRSSMHASGTGKAILAAMSAEALGKIGPQMQLDGFTSNTHTTLDGLSEDLADIRARGWSFDSEERYLGMSCIGAAIYDEQGMPCAGVSVSGPSARFGSDMIDALGRTVVAAARDITELSGGILPKGELRA